MNKEIRWEQRFSNYLKALERLSEAINYINHNYIDDPENTDVLNNIIKEGLIQRFEYTHELAWKVMKDYAEYQGITGITGSRDATKEAFQMNLILDGQVWMNMIRSRNESSHTYNEETSDEIYTKILKEYFSAFNEFKSKMQTIILENKQTNLFSDQ